MMLTRAIVTAFGLIGILGCTQTPSKTLPPDFVNEMNAVAYAEAIASQCSTLAFDTQLESRVLIGFLLELEVRGYSQRDLEGALLNADTDATLKKIYEYMDRRRIVLGREQSWCRAGRAEMAEGTRIGRYLIAT